jgi:hypothetical protein
VKAIPGVTASVLIGAALLSGCSEGYPTDDEGPHLNYTLSARDAIQVMAQLGNKSQSWGSYEFSVNPDCIMTIERQRWFLWRSQSQVDLKTARFDVRAIDSAFELVAWQPSQVKDQVVIEDLPRFVSQQGLWLLNYMARFC